MPCTITQHVPVMPGTKTRIPRGVIVMLQTDLLFHIQLNPPNAYLIMILRLVYAPALPPSVREWYQCIITLSLFGLYYKLNGL